MTVDLMNNVSRAYLLLVYHLVGLSDTFNPKRFTVYRDAGY